MTATERCASELHERDPAVPGVPFNAYVGWDQLDYVLCRCLICGQQYGALADTPEMRAWMATT
jgi:hypothetical protein